MDHTRVTVPVRVFRLGEEPLDNLAMDTSAEERIEMVIALTARMLELSGATAAAYSRANIPVHVIRPR